MSEWSDYTLNKFKIYLEKLGRSRNTVRSYSTSVSTFFRLFEELSIADLKAYRSWLISHYRVSTVNIRVYGMNQYLEFLQKFGMLPRTLICASDSGEMPRSTKAADACGLILLSDESGSASRPERKATEQDIYKMQPVKEQKKNYLDTVISQRDYEKLKRNLKNDGNFYWYFVVRFLGATGARVSELLQIKIEDLKLGYLDLYSKGGKIRRLYFPRSLCCETIPWFEARGLVSGFIFLNQHGNLITVRGIELQLKQLARRYKINPDTVYPHSFRHRFAKNFLRKFNDISLLADLMGHDSIETTRIYLTRSSQEQKMLLDRIIVW